MEKGEREGGEALIESTNFSQLSKKKKQGHKKDQDQDFFSDLEII